MQRPGGFSGASSIRGVSHAPFLGRKRTLKREITFLKPNEDPCESPQPVTLRARRDRSIS